ncbi:hypothetical protein Ahy_B08g094313 [Arachis hypogaea]|uniref:Uncharacterized protein n=1 Tax=Arachis hypogaea TaxID=3818 RepID=A0A444Y8S8_ARAHY|nr:hypothetical protein Ahy_B08g094313 [Arachis hypogaea]
MSLMDMDINQTEPYRTVGRWNDTLAIRKLMEDRGVKKMPGKSWIECENQKRSHFDLANMEEAV